MKMADADLVDEILAGSVDNVPPVAPSTVRVFISSTFSDMISERNALMKHTYPKLKQFAKQYGLEFQVVDMRWGIREEAQDDHMTSSLCMQEIHNCQRLSIGPNFVMLIGQKYGFRPFPACIAVEEYELLYASLVAEDVNTDLLDQWFLKDENSDPPEYRLQQISVMLPDYVNKAAPELQDVARQAWNAIFMTLQRLLRTAAHSCHLAGTLSEQQRQKYFISVTEDEVYHGLLAPFVTNPSQQLIFRRVIDDLGDHLAHQMAFKYTDLTPEGSVDTEANRLLTDFCDNKISQVIKPTDISQYNITWAESGGVNPKAHKEYLNQLCTEFEERMRREILAAIKKRDDFQQQDPLYVEVLQHATWCKARCTTFQGRTDELQAIRDYVTDDEFGQLFVVHGESGSGKTSLMAMAAHGSRTWFGENRRPVIVTRLLGTTPCSSGAHSVLNSICQQVARNYGRDPTAVPTEFNPLCQHFKDLLKTPSYEKPLIIFLDSLDQLSLSNGAYRLAWLPNQLPQDVRVVVSTLPKIHGILFRLQFIVPDKTQFLEVTALEPSVCDDMMNVELRKLHRKVTPWQEGIARAAIRKCSLPLYTRIVCDEISRWKSFTPKDKCVLEHCRQGAINALLRRIELYHGTVLVSHALSYITASRNGLSESELEDLLSLDDEVLEEVFTFWLPPVRRIPPLLWTRIREDLHGFLVEREANQTTVLAWYHRQFHQVAAAKYFKDSDNKLLCHSMLADYFKGTWAGVKKPFIHPESLVQKLRRSYSTDAQDRKVCAQPMSWQMDNGETRYNLRKLAELPYHLYRSKRMEELCKDVFFNYKWLHSRLHAATLAEVLSDYSLCRELTSNPDINLVTSMLRIAGSALTKLSGSLASEVMGRLGPCACKHPDILSLVTQSKEQGSDECVLMPVHPCFECPSECMLFTFEGHSHLVTDVVFDDESEIMYATSMDGIITMWDIKTGEKMHVMDVTQGHPSRRGKLLLSGRYLAYESYKEGSPLCVFEAQTGQKIHVIDMGTDVRPGRVHNTCISGHFVLRDGVLVDLKAGSVVGELSCLRAENHYVNAYLFHDGLYVSIGGRDETSVWNLETKSRLLSISAKHISSCMQCSMKEQIVAIGYSFSCEVKFYEVAHLSRDFGKELYCFRYKDKSCPTRKFREGMKEVTRMVVSPLDEELLVNIQRQHLYVVSMKRSSLGKSTEMDTEWNREMDEIHNISFTSDSKTVIATVAGALYQWDKESGNILNKLPLSICPADKIMMTTSKTSNLAATFGFSENIVKIWNLDLLDKAQDIDRCVYSHPVDNMQVVEDKGAAFIKTYRRLDSEGGYKFMDYFGVDAWDLPDYKRSIILPFGKYGVLNVMSCTKDGRILTLVVTTKGSDYIYGILVRNGSCIFEIKESNVQRVVLDDDGTFLIYECSNDKNKEEIKSVLWNVAENKIENTFPRVSGMIFADNADIVGIIGERHLFTYSLYEQQENKFPMKGSIQRLQRVPGNRSRLLVSCVKKASCSNVYMINYQTGRFFSSYTTRGSPEHIIIAAQGHHAIDGQLNVFFLDGPNYGQRRLPIKHNDFLRCTNNSKKNVLSCISADGQYVIFADTHPVDCLKVYSTDGHPVSSPVSTHAAVTSLTLIKEGHHVIAGCKNGRLIVFKCFLYQYAGSKPECGPMERVSDEVVARLELNARHVYQLSMKTSATSLEESSSAGTGSCESLKIRSRPTSADDSKSCIIL